MLKLKKIDVGETIKTLQKIVMFDSVTPEQRKTCGDAILLLNGMLEQLEKTRSCLLCQKNTVCNPDGDDGTLGWETWNKCRIESRHLTKHKSGWVWKGVQK